MGKLVLIDGHSILNRAFYGVPPLTNFEGIHTNAIYGFLNIMFKIIDEEKPDHLAVAFDLSEPTFRHKMYGSYKGTRKPMPEELHEQVPLMKEVLAAMGIPVLTLPGYEADDILGTAAKRVQAAGEDVTIVSGDRDLLQLADEHIKICLPKTTRAGTEVKNYYPEDVKREYKVTPIEYIDVKALMGDPSDNIPGVPSIGEKTATNLIAAYGSIENLHNHLDEVKPPRAKKALMEHFDMAVMSRKLAAICTDCPLAFSYEDAALGNLYTSEACQYMNRLGFKSILARFDEKRAGGSVSSLAEEHFWSVGEPEAVEEIFARAAAAERLGLQLILFEEQDHENDGSMHTGGEDAAEGDPSRSGRENRTAGVSLCFGEEDCYLFPVQGEVTGEYLCRKVRSLLDGISQRGGQPVATLDLKEQLKCLELSYGSPILDAGVAAYLLNPLKDSYDYADLAGEILGMAVPPRERLLGKRRLSDVLEQGEALTCACYISYIAWKAMPVIMERLRKQGMEKLFLTMEMPLVYSLADMELAGIRTDKQQLKEYGDRLKLQIEKLEQEIYGLVGETFNINSPKQLGEVLFVRLGLPHGKKTKTGYSTAAEVLEKLAPEYPIVQMILDYRQYTKLNSTYAEGLAAFIRADGRIHGKFHQTITATGRISSADPNLQNIPVRMDLGREIRKVFVPADGCVFVDADYSQIELRILAHMSGDETLIQAYQDAQDIHAITASKVFGIPLTEVTPLERRRAKAVNFGIVYGISAFGLSEGLSISRKEAVEFIDQYFETFPGVRRYLDGQVEDGRAKGYVTTLYGRRRPIPELKSSQFSQRSFGERVAMNSPIQGTAADIMKLAMVAVDRELRKRGLRSRIVLQVHDELLVEAPESEKEEVSAILVDKMQHAASLKVALEVSVSSGKSWFDAK